MSKSIKDITIRARDGYQMSVRVFDCEDPKAVIMFIHGMEENKDRYDDFARFLQEHRYTVLTYDMRGHGKNAPLLSHIADKEGDRLLAEDVLVLTRWLKKQYPDKNLYLFAHSMGSILARKILQKNSGSYGKVVLSGYPVPQKAASAGVLLTNVMSLFKGGKKGHSAIVTNMAMGGFSKAIADAKTPLDWLSYNEENVKRYQEDPLCGVEFTLGSYDTLFRLVRDIADEKLYENVKTDLPIYLISGEDDPCTGGEQGRKVSIDVLKKAGFQNIDVHTINHMRHEILQENGRENVYSKILSFFDKNTG